MFKISEIIDNVSKYGNSRVYLYNGNNTNIVIDFMVDNKGYLITSTSVLTGENKPYFDGYNFNEDFILKSDIPIDMVAEEDEYNAYAMILYKTFNMSGEDIGVETEEEWIYKTPIKAVKRLYNGFRRMMTNWSNRELYSWQKGNEKKIIETLLSKLKVNRFDEDIPYEIASSCMEGVLASFYRSISVFSRIHEKVEGSSTTSEFDEAMRQLVDMLDNTEIMASSFEVKKNIITPNYVFDLIASLLDNGEDSVIGNGIISSYSFNRDGLVANKDKIANVLVELGLDKQSIISLEDLTHLKNGKVWNYLNSYEEFEVLELLLAASDACKFIINDKKRVSKNITLLGNSYYMISKGFRSYYANESDWLKDIKEHILDKMEYQVNYKYIISSQVKPLDLATLKRQYHK